MAVTQDKSAPYAPPSTVLEVVTRYRERGLPKPINAEVLARAGISETVIPRTLQTLQVLDLIDEDGTPTSTLEGIRLSTETDFQKCLKEWLNSVYADVIQFVDPEKDDEVKVRDAFRSYNPVGQQSRMVTLFLGLYAAAGVRGMSAPKAPSQRIPRPASAPTKAKYIPNNRPPRSTSTATLPSGLPPALAGLLADLPQDGNGWTKAKRDRFVGAFQAMLDYSIPIVEKEPVQDSEEDEAA